ncbi:hypothetical protein AX14_004615 [Amanita brunnescens Koide BX004]|nr:hypothetical protein AX14_004615 [Amanita brunnescens Koide BX004]
MPGSLSRSPRRTPNDDGDMDVDKNTSPPHKSSNNDKSDMKVVIVTNLTRNVVESHLQVIFGFYGPIAKVDLPLFGKSGQNRGKAALEFVDATSAQQAASHMDGGQLDGAVLKVELSNLPIRARSRSPRRGAPPPPTKNGRERDRRALPRLCLSEVIAEVGKDPPMVVVSLIAVGPMDVVEVDQDVMCTVLSGLLEVVRALGPCHDVRAIDLVLGGGPLVIPEEALVTSVESLGRAATVCAPVALDRHRTPGLGLALVPCRTLPIPDLAGAEVVLVDQGLHVNYDFQLLY